MSESTELVNVDEQLAKEAANIASAISAPSSNRIKTGDKNFMLPDGQVLPAPLDVVIVDFVTRHAYYDKPYNQKNPSPPACWGIGREPANMIPDSTVESPMNATCSGCPYDEYGSSPTGGGKACKNSRYMAVVIPSLIKDGEKPTIYTLEASPTAIKAFDAYVNVVAKLYNSSPIKVITEVSFHPEKTFAQLMFGNPRANEDYAAHFMMREEASALLEIPMATPGAEDSAPSKPARRSGGRS